MLWPYLLALFGHADDPMACGKPSSRMHWSTQRPAPQHVRRRCGRQLRQRRRRKLNRERSDRTAGERRFPSSQMGDGQNSCQGPGTQRGKPALENAGDLLAEGIRPVDFSPTVTGAGVPGHEDRRVESTGLGLRSVGLLGAIHGEGEHRHPTSV
ncbi:hypothetical protein T07_11739 [Trichinella nelsoni]|uniref:Uncharacterized protein n=1 Tax=Trichinella nelsoni TaxID=6336 RepID=A0A0V0RZQ2_9BILA|nr:hypothetical protein T07_11739 [Trichinella nelsoni]